MLRGQMDAQRRRLQEQRQREMMTTLGAIAGGMAHELSTPLANIQAEVDYARRYLLSSGNGVTADELRAAFDAIERQKKLMAELITHLRDLARGDHLALEPVSLETVVRKAEALQGRQLRAHEIELEIACAPRTPPVRGNPLMLEQVALNLLVNARDALLGKTSGPRQIKILIRPRVLSGRTMVELRVADNGLGVPIGDRKRIFDPFFSTKAPGSGLGLGLGLSLAHKTVTEIGGDMTLESPSGGGAAFVVMLPAFVFKANDLAVSSSENA